MPGVFLSHSSADKSFVGKLAIDLTLRDIPVWFDTWELELGHSLTRKIFDGLDESMFVLVLLSPAAVKSSWVQREIAGALVKEQRLGRTFVIPIKITDCEPPLEIADRIFVDFSDRGYLTTLEKLETLLRKRGAGNIAAPPEHQIIPIIFSLGEYLNKVALENRLDRLQSILPKEYRILAEQVLISPDDKYDWLRQRLLKNVETIQSRHSYTPEGEEFLQRVYDGVRRYEEALIKGLVLILNVWRDRDTRFSVVESCYWFGRIMRNTILAYLHGTQLSEDQERSDYGAKCLLNPTSDNQSAKQFFDLDKVTSLHVFQPGSNEYVPVWIDGNSRLAKSFDAMYPGTCSLAEASTTLLEKFIIPQLVVRISLGSSNLPIANLQSLELGLP